VVEIRHTSPILPSSAPQLADAQTLPGEDLVVDSKTHKFQVKQKPLYVKPFTLSVARK